MMSSYDVEKLGLGLLQQENTDWDTQSYNAALVIKQWPWNKFFQHYMHIQINDEDRW